MTIKLEVESRTIANGLQSSGFGFDPISIITIALGLWSQCQQKQSPGENPAEMLRARFNDGKFDQELLDDARHNARKANRIAFRRGQSEKRHLSDEELDQVSTAAFMHVMDADDDVLKSCGAEAFGMSFDDDDDAE